MIVLGRLIKNLTEGKTMQKKIINLMDCILQGIVTDHEQKMFIVGMSFALASRSKLSEPQSAMIHCLHTNYCKNN